MEVTYNKKPEIKEYINMLNLPLEIWYVFIGAGALFLFPVIVIYLAHRALNRSSY